jgi:hypothetical protein
MERFIERYQDRILGVLSGFDRMLFRGTLRSLSYVNGMEIFLSCQGVLYKDLGAFVDKLSGASRNMPKRSPKRPGGLIGIWIRPRFLRTTWHNAL